MSAEPIAPPVEEEAAADQPATVGRRNRRFSPARLLEVHSLLLLSLLLFLVFSLLLPSTFPTAFNIRSILGTKAIIAFLALAVMVPLAAGQFDLSVGYALGLTQVLVIGLQTKSDIAWPIAVLLVILVGALIGLVNGLLVTVAKIDSFIATLATGTFVYGLSSWYTGGIQIVGALPHSYTQIANIQVTEFLPLPALFVLAAALVLYVVLEFLPTGRRLYALGANPRAAELVGVPARRYIICSFVSAGVLVGIAGAILGAQLQAGVPGLGPEYLLPAFVAALLGATSVRPGRVNVWGTVIAVLLLAIGIAGLQQLGAKFFVEPLFNGATLAIAVGLAGFASRQRLRRGASDPQQGGAPARPGGGMST